MSGSAAFFVRQDFGRTFAHYRRTLPDAYFLGPGLIAGTAGTAGNHR